MTALPLGATPLDAGRGAFRVWAPHAERVAVHLVADPALGAADARPESETARLEPLERGEHGYHEAVLDDVAPGDLYLFRLDDERERPDPASRWQPHGVHGPSAVWDARFAWADDGWTGRPLGDHVFYELHVGTFTREGTFAAAAERLDALVDLGITAVEVMPVAQFPGERNWGYDGVYPFAVQSSYGGPDAFQGFVDACHARRLSVFLDVVYNHVGPEGNYLDSFGPYFTDRYTTPWGRAINFDGAQSNAVRAFVIDNALQWVRDFHVDGLRLDAIHGIFDFSARHILEELQDAVQAFARESRRTVHVVAESDLNDARIIRPKSQFGFGLDGQWSDDFHHALHVLLTGERNGYYGDFGTLDDLAKSLREGFVYTGQYSRFRMRNHGGSTHGLPPEQFVICTQNHDQVGNRLLGDRLTAHLGVEAQKLSAAVLILAPHLPLLFMGQEYGETAPFCYFVSHSDEKLIAAVRRGRKRDFASFDWRGKPPDPQAASSFTQCILDWSLRDALNHRVLLDFHRELLRLRRELITDTPSDALSPQQCAVHTDDTARFLVMGPEDTRWALVAHFRAEPADVSIPLASGTWNIRLDAASPRFGGSGEPHTEPLHSQGNLSLTLPAWGCLVLSRT